MPFDALEIKALTHDLTYQSGRRSRAGESPAATAGLARLGFLILVRCDDVNH